jgi:hypothetical protein
MAPHFGHLTFVSFVYVAHPKEKTAKAANTKNILTHFLITAHLLSSIYIYFMAKLIHSKDYGIILIKYQKSHPMSRKKINPPSTLH